jgi:type I restriction enzyme S subunit
MNVVWVPFLEAITDVSAGNIKVPASAFLPAGALPVIDQGKELVGGWTDDNSARVPGRGPVIVFGDHTRIFKFVDFPFAVGADGVKVLRAREGFDTKYLYFFFSSLQIPSAGYSRHFKFLKEFRVPKPPLEEQRRIAAILDRADSLRTKCRQGFRVAEALRTSIFDATVGVESWRAVSTSSQHATSAIWPSVPLSDVATLATGHTPDRRKSEYWNGGISWLSLPEIRAFDGQICRATKAQISAVGVANSSSVVLPAGTVCFSRTASVGFVTIMGRPMATSQDFHNWIPKSELTSVYLLHALRRSRIHLIGLSDGSIHKTIYQRLAQQFRLLLPPLSVQNDFVAKIEAVDTWAQKLGVNSQMSDELFESLQSRAFRGEL